MSFNNQKAVEIYTAKTELFPIEETLFKKHLTTPQRILDLGCGTGRTTRHLKDMGHKVIGVDIAPQMIQQAEALHPDIPFQVGDATQLNHPDEYFDSVLFSFNGLDYIYPETDRIQALQEINRVLKHGGLFLFSSHDYNGIKRITLRRIRKIRHHEGYFYREKTVYGTLITYYGTVARNIRHLRCKGFDKVWYSSLDGRTWRYYKCVKL